MSTAAWSVSHEGASENGVEDSCFSLFCSVCSRLNLVNMRQSDLATQQTRSKRLAAAKHSLLGSSPAAAALKMFNSNSTWQPLVGSHVCRYMANLIRGLYFWHAYSVQYN